jgi:rubrerythrin
MDEPMKAMVEGLRQALLAERTGHEFYKMAAKNTKDPTARATFQQLAKEEKEHFEYLAAHYRSLLENGASAPEVDLPTAERFTPDHAIFSPALKARLRQAHFEMSALAIAAQLELNSILHYQRQAEQATIPQLRRLYQALLAWETSHYEALHREQQALEDDYFAAAGFTPF